MGAIQSPFGAGLELQASTGEAGFTLQPALTPILSWTTPNDGQLHRVVLFFILDVSAALTGGIIQFLVPDPLGNNSNTDPGPGGSAAGVHGNVTGQSTFMAGPGKTVTLTQESGVTAGAGVVWAEIWGA